MCRACAVPHLDIHGQAGRLVVALEGIVVCKTEQHGNEIDHLGTLGALLEMQIAVLVVTK